MTGEGQEVICGGSKGVRYECEGVLDVSVKRC